MVKNYQRIAEAACLGLIYSPVGAALLDEGIAAVPALEDVILWDLKRGEAVGTWHAIGLRSAVTCLARSPANEDVFAVGYADGSIRIWSRAQGAVTVVFDGHRRAITALAFDTAGQRLASASQDTELVVWDIAAETGLFRLRGHRDQVTTLAFAGPDHLLSAGKDTLLKLWHLPTRHCIDTAVAHRSGGCWTSAIVDLTPATDGDFHLLTGGGEGEVRLWRIDVTIGETSRRRLHLLGQVPLSSATVAQRIARIAVHSTQPIIAVQTTERHVELCRLRSDGEMRKRDQRRRKRLREKAVDDAVEDNSGSSELDRIAQWRVVQTGAKIRALAFATEHATTTRRKPRAGAAPVKLLLGLANNSIETFEMTVPSLEASDKAAWAALPDPARAHAVLGPGHRNDVRALAISSDDLLIASVANGEVKVWNRRTGKCVRTISETGYGLCCTWLPGDKHLVVGTREGGLLILDVAASSCVFALPDAHAGAIWSVQLRGDGRAIATGSADQSVKFFDLEIRRAPSSDDPAPPQLVLVHTRTLKLTDDVLCIRLSPDGRLLAVSLLDSTVKVFYADSLKFYLSLYGHKLPVLSMDIAADSKLIATCSADKNVKLWGLDFGDCHRSIFAHDDSVMGVAFEADTHQFFTVGKDALLKHWDGNKFQLIQKLVGHHAEIWAVATSNRGGFAVTAGADRSIRIWETTDEPLFLEEERERELEALLDSNTSELRAEPLAPGALVDGASAQEVDETTDAGKTTVGTLSDGERIAEAVDRALADRNASPEAPRDPVLAQYGETAAAHVLRIVSSVAAANLGDALLILSYDRSVSLLAFAAEWLQERRRVLLAARVVHLVLRLHNSQIIANQALRAELPALRRALHDAVSAEKAAVSYNACALKTLSALSGARRIEDTDNVQVETVKRAMR